MKIMAILLGIAATFYGGEMISVRKSEERGKGDHGWLSAQYTFSFSSYYDAKQMGFRTLRVINEDVVAPTKGFDTHPHDNMEILTYVIDGTLAHKDTMGNQSHIKKGEFQLMSAGTGVKHSEFNPSQKEPVHLLQIWIHPNKRGITPSYDQKGFEEHKQGLKLVVSPDGSHGSMKIHQNAKVYLGRFEKADTVSLSAENGWIQMVQGQVHIHDIDLYAGDGAALQDMKNMECRVEKGTELLLFELN